MPPQLKPRRISTSVSSIASSSGHSSPTYSFHTLPESPPPSPGPYPLLPYHTKKPTPSRSPCTSKWAVIAFLVVSVVVSGIWVLRVSCQPLSTQFEATTVSYGDEKWEIVGVSGQRPSVSSPLVVADHRKHPKWTMYLAKTEDYPLQPDVYAQLCSESKLVAAQVANGTGQMKHRRHGDRFNYYQIDKNFMDVQEAESHGFLPATSTTTLEADQVHGSDKICERSLTYVMETTDAGFGNTLMGLWMAYGLAQKERRSFFVDDRNWAYGKYTTFFRPPPSSSCLPPPDHHRLPCPHHARHLLVSPATFPWTFGQAFNDHFEYAHRHGVLRQKKIFALLRTGYEALFHLAEVDAGYLEKRLQELHGNPDDLTIGIHVRHGDRRPWEYQYEQSYTPLGKYADAARAMIVDAHIVKNSSAKTILASDDPEVYTSAALSHAERAQSQIQLAGKPHLQGSQQPVEAIHRFVEEGVGWEGGFFKDTFWNLGSPPQETMKAHRRGSSDRAERNTSPSELTLELRGLVGRAYLLDLAVLGSADRVVCGISSVGCRILAVMMGWDRAIVKNGWRNVDGAFGWEGLEI